jgi:dCMP deaminase
MVYNGFLMIELKQKFIDAYMDTAERFAQLSSATRLKVGAIIVKDNRIISIGYNGMPSGWDNVCEFKELTYDPRDVDDSWTYDSVNKNWWRLKTKPEVVHAEMNCLMKLAGSNESSTNGIMFITHAPCIECAKAIGSSGIGNVYYRNIYRSDDGVKHLNKLGINILHLNGG